MQGTCWSDGATWTCWCGGERTGLHGTARDCMGCMGLLVRRGTHGIAWGCWCGGGARDCMDLLVRRGRMGCMGLLVRRGAHRTAWTCWCGGGAWAAWGCWCGGGRTGLHGLHGAAGAEGDARDCMGCMGLLVRRGTHGTAGGCWCGGAEQGALPVMRMAAQPTFTPTSTQPTPSTLPFHSQDT